MRTPLLLRLVLPSNGEASSSSVPMPANETARHLDLKRRALAWAQAHGYRIAAAEVDVPHLGARLDVAAFRPARGGGRRAIDHAEGVGTTVIFECKQSRADFVKDSRSATQIIARLAKLHERRTLYEESMRPHWPSLRNRDTLFPEFDSYRFEAAGYEPYDSITKELRTLSARLHSQTKFAQLIRWRAANLHYVVAEEGVARAHELPHGWGLLVHTAGALSVAVEPAWQEATEEARMGVLLRIAIVGTRAVNRSLGV
jgi:hypothetical protein